MSIIILPPATQTASDLTLPRWSLRRPKSFLSEAHRSWPWCGKRRNPFQRYLLGFPIPRVHGVVANLSRPGANLTGFANFEPAIGGKWLQTLKEVAPNVTRVAVLRNPDGLKRIMTAIETSAPAFGVEALECSARNAEEIARVLGSVAGRPNTGLIMMPDPILTISGRLIIDWAAT